MDGRSGYIVASSVMSEWSKRATRNRGLAAQFEVNALKTWIEEMQKAGVL
jgi:hypothetical protein